MDEFPVASSSPRVRSAGRCDSMSLSVCVRVVKSIWLALRATIFARWMFRGLALVPLSTVHAFAHYRGVGDGVAEQVKPVEPPYDLLCRRIYLYQNRL